MFRNCNPQKTPAALFIVRDTLTSPTLDYAPAVCPHRVLVLELQSWSPLSSPRRAPPCLDPATFNDGANHPPPHTPRRHSRQFGSLINGSAANAHTARITKPTFVFTKSTLYPVGHIRITHAISSVDIPIWLFTYSTSCDWCVPAEICPYVYPGQLPDTSNGLPAVSQQDRPW
jgi:hypothetical protein